MEKGAMREEKVDLSRLDYFELIEKPGHYAPGFLFRNDQLLSDRKII
jgi:hypothetical protein